MKFTLVFDGSLPPTGNNSNARSKKKWEVRKAFDPQLRELWRVRPDLSLLREDPIIPRDDVYMMQVTHHLEKNSQSHSPRDPKENPPEANEINLLEPIRKGTRAFFPLVRNSLGLTCSLRILFMRNEPRGHLFEKGVEAGDIDNRLKTLFDALGIPRDEYVYEDAFLTDPIYCLIEDDSLITGYDVRTEHLLSPQGTDKKEARLYVEVDVRISHPRVYNAAFGGD